MLLIAIDFDETLTRDSALWKDFIQSCKRLGHTVICITSRRDTEDNNETITNWMHSHGIDIPYYFTGLASKLDHAKKIGLKVDIWIDDDPRRAVLGH